MRDLSMYASYKVYQDQHVPIVHQSNLPCKYWDFLSRTMPWIVIARYPTQFLQREEKEVSIKK